MSNSPFDMAKIVGQTLTDNPTAAVILAAGNSTRMGGGINKQFEKIDGIPVLAHTLLAYQKCPLIRDILVVARPEDFEEIYRIHKQFKITKLRHLVVGGKDRQESARLGFSKIAPDIRFVAIADGARCLTTPVQIAKICFCAYRTNAASAAHKVSDSVKRTDASGNIVSGIDRENLWMVQTPQIFHTALYAAALVRAQEDDLTVTDDNSLVEHLGYKIRLLECGIGNLKITTKEDLSIAEAILKQRKGARK